jgi:23S rRNA pseudouridine955/2504/2580 synthase
MTTKPKNSPYFIEIDSERAGQRIDNFLLNQLKNVPKSRVYRLVRKGEVRVNKKRIKPDYRLESNDIVRIPPFWEVVAPPKLPPRAQDIAEIEAHILFEDKHLIVLNKPAGMPVHGGTGLSFGVINLLRLARPQAKYLELAHRLDRDTSGCLILAKKSSVLKEIHALFREGKVLKVYWALVKGAWPKEQDKIDVPLLKNQLKSGERIVAVSEQGKAALTAFRVLRYFDNCTLLEVTLHTGRTHQIRVHAAYAGHPIVGDEKYGEKEFNKLMRKKTCQRMFLHAKHLFMEFPSGNPPLDVTADVGVDWQHCFSRLEGENESP